MASPIDEKSSNKCFGGYVKQFTHKSEVLACDMMFSVFVPPQAEHGPVPVLFWLSGLTCNDQNFITKAGAQKAAAEHGILLVAPDTSPRGCNIEGEDDGWDFGSGAGFYVDATEEKWRKHYNMYSYVTEELPLIIHDNFPTKPDSMGVFGHSMGGHGALICALKNPGMYKSVSAFAPICNPINCAWGKKALAGYLGSDEEAWKEYDATELVARYQGPPLNILIDQGKNDSFYKVQQQLLPENFVQACALNQMPVALRVQDGYDHSYYFIATFIDEHIAHHAALLKL